MIQSLLALWVDEFHSYQESRGVAYFDNVMFNDAVKSEMTARRITPEIKDERGRCAIC